MQNLLSSLSNNSFKQFISKKEGNINIKQIAMASKKNHLIKINNFVVASWMSCVLPDSSV